MHRFFTLLFSLFAVAAAGMFPVNAQTVWPTPGAGIRIVVPAGKNMTIDTVARLLAPEMGKTLAIDFLVENVPDDYGITGTDKVASAKPDGLTLLLSWSGSLVVNPSLFKTLPYHPEHSLDAIGLVAEVPNILVVNNALPVHDVKEFTAYVHANPGKLNFGSTGSGRAMHLAGQLYMNATDTNMVHVSYSSIDLATSNLINGQIESMFQLVPRVLKPINEKLIRPLGVMSRKRLPVLPNVPTMAEQGYPELISTVWFALSAPRGTPPEIIGLLNRALNRSLENPELIKKLEAIGAVPLGGSPEAMDMVISHELKKWEGVVRAADIPFN